MARLFAFIGAVLMIVGALAVRGYIDLPGIGGGSRGGNDDTSQTVVCAAELGDVCGRLEGAVTEPAMKTAERLVALPRGEDPELGLWLVPGPWPQLVNDVRALQSLPPIFERSETLARSPLVVIATERGASLVNQACGGQIGWLCIGDAARGGQLRMGGPALDAATGNLVRAAALSAKVGHVDFGVGDIDDDGLSWITGLGDAIDAGRDFGATSVQRFVTQRGSADIFATAQAIAAAEGVPGSFQVLRPQPTAVATLTLGVRRGADVPDIDHGWPEAPSLPESDGLPSPDVLFALRDIY